MPREFSHYNFAANDLFGSDTGGCGSQHKTCSASAEKELRLLAVVSNLERPTARPSISENLWQDARRRHCDARQSWRNLLDRFVKPHH